MPTAADDQAKPDDRRCHRKELNDPPRRKRCARCETLKFEADAHMAMSARPRWDRRLQAEQAVEVANGHGEQSQMKWWKSRPSQSRCD
jgi:hypothetical protein